MDVQTVRDRLSAEIEKVGSLRKWAAKHKLSPAFVSDVVRGNRPPSDAILKPLGLKRITQEPLYGRAS